MNLSNEKKSKSFSTSRSKTEVLFRKKNRITLDEYKQIRRISGKTTLFNVK